MKTGRYNHRKNAGKAISNEDSYNKIKIECRNDVDELEMGNGGRGDRDSENKRQGGNSNNSNTGKAYGFGEHTPTPRPYTRMLAIIVVAAVSYPIILLLYVRLYSGGQDVASIHMSNVQGEKRVQREVNTQQNWVEESNLDVCARARTNNTSATFYSWKGQCRSPNWSVSQTMKGEDGRLTLATIIPALKRDGYEIMLTKLMESIEMETVPPNEVVIAMSDVGRDEENAFCNSFLKNLTDVFSKSPIKLICIGERMTAGMARNIAAKSSTSELLSMMDSDDTESPIRNEVSRNIFECRGGKLKIFLHSFFQSYGQKKTPSAIPDGYKCAEHENGTERLLGEQLYDLLSVSHNRLWIHAPIHHGWPVVHRSVFTEVSYSSLRQGEDALFIRDVMYSFGRHNNTALFLKRPLGFYVKSGQSNKDLQ